MAGSWPFHNRKLITIQTAAAALRVGPNKLFAFLREQQLLTETNMPDAVFYEYFAVLKKTRGQDTFYRTYVNEAGFAFIDMVLDIRVYPRPRDPRLSRMT